MCLVINTVTIYYYHNYYNKNFRYTSKVDLNRQFELE